MVVVKREAGAAESSWDFYRFCASQDHLREGIALSPSAEGTAGCAAFNRV
jgi:hypothetical protein